MTLSTDKRWDEVAKVLVDYSTTTTNGDRVLIIMREPETFPLVRAVSARCVAAGAYPQVLFYSIYLDRDLMKLGTIEQAEWVPEVWQQAMDWADVCIDLRGARNLYEYNDIAPERVAAHRKAEGKISALRTQTTRWTLSRIPTEALAQQAGRSLDEMMEFYFDAVLQDWEAETERLKSLQTQLTGTREVRIHSKDTDLIFSTEGRSYVVEDGRVNVPGGELFTSPLEDSVEGHIRFTNPGVFAGVLMEDIYLKFRGGVVVEATARTNEDFLHQLLDMDPGARRVGEFAVGTNRKLTFFCNDILYDEKIFGTVHIALGRSYTECGGKNESALHWDIVKDLRADGAMYIDGKKLLEQGRWLQH